MDNELTLHNNSLDIDSHELLLRFIFSCQNEKKDSELKMSLLSSADIVSAVYYFRKYPNVNDFLEACLKNSNDYFKIQWIRSTWADLEKLNPSGLSDLVIKQISLVANLEKEQ